MSGLKNPSQPPCPLLSPYRGEKGETIKRYGEFGQHFAAQTPHFLNLPSPSGEGPGVGCLIRQTGVAPHA
jgi:hypothetical protein